MTTTVIKFVQQPQQITWLPRPKDRSLEENEVHVWLANLELEIYAMSKFLRDLSLTERARAQNLRFEHDRRRFVIAKGLLRNLLAGYLSVAPNEIQFSLGQSGKPEIADRQQHRQSPLHFNQAHSGHLGIYVLSRKRRVGVDIEEIRPFPDMEQLAPMIFSKQEMEAFHSLGDDEKQNAFFSTWTHKEAFVKAIGKGLTVPLSHFDVSRVHGNLARIVQNHQHPALPLEWFVKDLSISAQFSAAVCVEGEGWKLQCLKW
jgi:4'-phosphopantetheinyl transferase